MLPPPTWVAAAGQYHKLAMTDAREQIMCWPGVETEFILVQVHDAGLSLLVPEAMTNMVGLSWKHRKEKASDWHCLYIDTMW